MTELQAVIGRIQLRKLSGWTLQRNATMNRLFTALEGHSALRVPRPGPAFGHAAYKAYVYVRPEVLKDGWTRDRIMTAITDQGLPCFSGSCSEIYRETAFTALGLGPETPLPIAEELGETSLQFLVHPGLGDDYLQALTSALRNTLEQAARPMVAE
jgi:dTDP-4-amino-4,6-dideoxygalactose transaminase